MFNKLRLKDYQNMTCEKRPLKDAAGKLSFSIHHFLKMKNKPAEKKYSPSNVFLNIKLKTTSKNSGTFEAENFA